MDPWSLRVTSEHFEEHLNVLTQVANPISLSQLARGHQEGNIPDRSVVVTFDDGYANNLHCGKPLMEKYDVPATVFVASSFVLKKTGYWWDDLALAILRPGQLPDQLELTVQGESKHWELGEAATFSKEQAQANRLQGPWSADPGTRSHFYLELWQTLVACHPEERESLLDEIKGWANFPIAEANADYRAMTPEELVEFESGGLMELGGHTANHPLLGHESLEVQRHEILQNMADLESMLNHKVESFAYPFGNFGSETEELLIEAGFKYACATTKESVWKKSPRYFLPRQTVHDYSGEELERLLSDWFKN